MKSKLLSKKFFCTTIAIILCITFIFFLKSTILAIQPEASPLPANLHAKYCALIDGESGRLLYGKDYNIAAPMASTTKIMTCYLSILFFDQPYICTTSSYAASMPDVQLNAAKGEQFYSSDLLFSLMLKSHNDTAIILAENYSYKYLSLHPEQRFRSEFSDLDLTFLTDDMLSSEDSSVLATFLPEQSKNLVKVFAYFMNETALEFGCQNTYYITPNGLDSSDENGEHHTTAYELAYIMSKCIKEPRFNEICETKNYTFSDLSNKYTYAVTNANAFLNMYDNIIAGKTGFTGNAGYCYVCAYQADGRTFIVALLACGWPSNKTYKWQDTRALLNYARENYYKKEVISPQILPKKISITHGESENVSLEYQDSCSILLCSKDQVNIVYHIPTSLPAPIYKGDIGGYADIYINDELYKKIDFTFSQSINKITYQQNLYSIIQKFLLIL